MPEQCRAEGDLMNCEPFEIESLVIATDDPTISRVPNWGLIRLLLVYRIINQFRTDAESIKI